MVAAPNLTHLKVAIRDAHARNEQSAHEPRLVRREQMEGRQLHHHHHHEHAPLPPETARLGKNLRQSSRRWMIGH